MSLWIVSSMKKKPGTHWMAGPMSSRVEAGFGECSLKHTNRRPHDVTLRATVIADERGGAIGAVLVGHALGQFGQGHGLVAWEVELNLDHRPPPTRSSYDGSAVSSALPLAVRRSRNAGTPSRSVWSSFGGAEWPGSSSFMG